MSEKRAIDPDRIAEELTEIVTSVLDREPEDIPFEADLLDELDVDSVMILEIVVTLERVYGLKIAQEEMVRVRSVKDTCELLVSHASKAAG